MSQPFTSAWNNLSTEPIDQSSRMPWGVKDNGITDSPQLSFTNSPLTPQLTSTTTSTSVVSNGQVNGNNQGVQQQDPNQQAPINYIEKKQYSMNEMFDVYHSLAAGNQFIPSYQTDDRIKSTNINTPMHIDLLEQRKNKASNDNINIDLKKLNINDSTNNDQADGESSWANASNPIVGSAHFQDDTTNNNVPSSSSPGSQKAALKSSSIIQGASNSSNTPLLSSNSNLPSVQNIPLLTQTNSFLQQHHQTQNSGPSTPLMSSIPDLTQKKLNLPPGLSPMIPSSEIKWYYLDPSGNTQGPFTGDMMQEWFSSNFFTLDLQIRRVGETNYRTLAEFIQQVGDIHTPFSQPLPPVNNFSQGLGTPGLTGVPGGVPSFNPPFGSSSLFFNNNNSGFPNGLQSSFFGSNNPLNNSFDMQSQFQQQNHQLGQQNWINANNSNNDFLQNQLYSSSSPFLQANNLTGLQSFGQQQPQQNNDSNSLAGTPLRSPDNVSNLNIDKDSLVLNGIHSRVVSDILEDDSFLANNQEHKPHHPESKQPEVSEQPKASSTEHSVQKEATAAVSDPAPISVNEVVKEPSTKTTTPTTTTTSSAPGVSTSTNTSVSNEKPKPVEEVKKSSVKPEATITNKPTTSKSSSTSSTLVIEEKTEKKPVVKKPSLAPWASVTSVKPAMTLDEIQKIENEKRMKALEEQAKKQEKIVASLTANDYDLNDLPELRSSSSSSDFQRNALPPTSNWASVGASHQTPVKTLEEIQKEEQEAAAKLKAKLDAEREAALAHTTFNALVGGTSSKTSFASAVSNPSSSSDTAWTVVSNSKKLGTTAKPAATTRSVVKNANVTPAVNPSLLRSISASGTPALARSDSSTSVSSNNINTGVPASSYTTEASNPAREVISWARTQLQGLNQSVNKEDVLSIMLQLPNGPEYTEIIADTVYSNSSTMDGRRFAQEFIKRRKNVEDIVEKHGISTFSWSDVLMNTDSNNADDWDLAFTKVVSKKNKKRN